MTPEGERRGKKPGTNPLYDDAKRLADAAWEDAVRFADALAPEVPVDAEPLSEWDQFNILMAAAAEFSPGYWDDPEALTDLFRLKQKFMGVEDKQLQELARVAKVQREGVPDPMMTPANPNWEQMLKAVKGAQSAERMD